jgi:hypothetical protein
MPPIGEDIMRSISIPLLRDALNILLDRFTAMGIDSVPLNHQFYWKILDDEKYVMDAAPRQPGVGDLFDDLDFTEKVADAGDDAVAYSLADVVPLLAYLCDVGLWQRQPIPAADD